MNGRLQVFSWVLLVALTCQGPAALAWGKLGHRVVGAYADQRLDPVAQAEVSRLLVGESEPTLAGVANWADEIRDGAEQRKETSPWHYVNFARDGCEYSAERFCAEGACVVGAIERFSEQLANRALSDDQRRDALKFLAHFVGDIHQPLHAGYADDRGGNRFQINYKTRGTNLHSVWDSLIISSVGLDEATIVELAAGRLSQPPALATPVDWAQASCKIVQHPDFYPPRRKIGDSYLDAKRPLAERQLARGGQRLAALLNHLVGEVEGEED